MEHECIISDQKLEDYNALLANCMIIRSINLLAYSLACFLVFFFFLWSFFDMVLFKMEKRDVDGKILNSYIFRSSPKFHRQSLIKCRVFLCSKRFPVGFQILENVKTMSFPFWTLLVINTKCALERGITSKCSLAVCLRMEWRSDSPALNSQTVLVGNKAIFVLFFFTHN